MVNGFSYFELGNYICYDEFVVYVGWVFFVFDDF